MQWRGIPRLRFAPLGMTTAFALAVEIGSDETIHMTGDERIFDIAVASIRRHSMDPYQWLVTRIGELHPAINGRLEFEDGELVLTSAYLSSRSWYVFTTRRIVACYLGKVASADPRTIVDANFGIFKGAQPYCDARPPEVPIETATITTADSTLQLEFETGKPSMAPIYATRYWQHRRKSG